MQSCRAYFRRAFKSGIVASIVAASTGFAQTPRFEVRQYVVEGNTLLSPGEIERAVAPHRGGERDFGDIQRALEALEAAYRARGYSAVSVQLPEQEVTGGQVRFRVVEARIARVVVEGNQHFSTQNVLAALPGLSAGDVPNARAMSESSAGQHRLGAVLQHANPFNRDHEATLAYTGAPEKPAGTKVIGPAGSTIRVLFTHRTSGGPIADCGGVFADVCEVLPGSCVVRGIVKTPPDANQPPKPLPKDDAEGIVSFGDQAPGTNNHRKRPGVCKAA